jgi:predicted transcriptional regulator
MSDEQQAVAHQDQDPVRPQDPDVLQLVVQLRADRLARGLSWQKYAKLMGQPFTTLYKLSTGATSKPHETTLYQLRTRLAELQAKDQGDEATASQGDTAGTE